MKYLGQMVSFHEADQTWPEHRAEMRMVNVHGPSTGAHPQKLLIERSNEVVRSCNNTSHNVRRRDVDHYRGNEKAFYGKTQ